MSETTHTHGGYEHHTGPEQRKKIWMTFFLLLGITALEFLIAFTMPASLLRVGIFVILTLVKAFYIVADFMHLKHEVKMLVWSLILPMTFAVWLLVVLIVEGGSIFLVK